MTAPRVAAGIAPLAASGIRAARDIASEGRAAELLERALLDAAVNDLRQRGMRLVVAESPAGREHEPMLALLRRSAFVREGSVPDFYRDGVALTLWVRRFD